MKKGGNIDIKAMTRGFADFLQRFHTIVFFVIIGAAMATALLMVVLTLGNTGNSADSTSDLINSSFDEQTIQALQQEEKSANESFQLPSGRTDPFVE